MTATLGKRTTAEEALRGADLSGKTAVITGAAAGIGAETARVLALAGAHVVISARNLEAAQKTADAINAAGKGKATVEKLDLTDLASIREAATSLTSLPAIDYLILNAGVMAPPETRTKYGWELQLATNHIGHHYFTRLLLPKLAAQGSPSRVVVLSSKLHEHNPAPYLSDLGWTKQKYSGLGNYGITKACNILFAREVNARMKAAGAPVEAFSLHPGIIATDLTRSMGVLGKIIGFTIRHGLLPGSKSVPQGAATSVYAAIAPELAGQGGAYLDDCHVARASRKLDDPELPAKLWEATEKLISEAEAKESA